MLKVSIIIPSFNQGEFIEETILSILNQTYKNFEIIIIDGGSNDNSVSIIKKHETKLKYWVSEKDLGQSDAINKGLKYASGEIVTWLNSDDYYETNTLGLVVKEFTENKTTGILHGKALLFGQDIKNKLIGLEKDIPLHQYLPYMRFPQPSSFLKREYLNTEFAVNTSLHYAMDFELIARAILSGAKIKRTDNLFSNYRLHEKSKSMHNMKFLQEWAFVVYTILNSFDNGQPFAFKLAELGLARQIEQTNKYKASIILTNEQAQDVFLQHVNLHYHYNYKAFNSAACKKISGFLKANYPEFYTTNNYNKYNFRLTFIPGFVLRIARKLNT